jgi:hypothetical protein
LERISNMRATRERPHFPPKIAQSARREADANADRVAKTHTRERECGVRQYR